MLLFIAILILHPFPYFPANFGGVFSLFIGMSVISFFEILIFFTVRLYRNYKDEDRKSSKVESFSKRAENHDVDVIQKRIRKQLRETINKY